MLPKRHIEVVYIQDSDSESDAKPSPSIYEPDEPEYEPEPEPERKPKAEHDQEKKPKLKSEPDQVGGSTPKKRRYLKPKIPWSPEEDAILSELLEEVIKTYIWPKVREDGRLTHRSSYGCQYHAKFKLDAL
ncbi:hypothetical protein M231_01959 [Tremella mesenterica]|uniref:Uncharacterized protein n=1 Tax=Tremella mesenterica TaxID=5217 RepID=A0A4V1M4K7_TREME|nr:hypothetical protein M231_01959 [Tremella mesenterica]